MKKIILACLCFTVVFIRAQYKKSKPGSTSKTISFDNSWLFSNTIIDDASVEIYDDKTWHKVDLPHDWSIEDLPVQMADSSMGPFSKASAGKAFTGHTVGGTGWYRKKFTSAISNNGVLYLHFDGVYMHAQVWINGHYLGNHPNGYTPFYYDIAPYLHTPGETNTIAVKVRNHGQNSRWYSGSGIYRHVWLRSAEKVHIAPMGINVTSSLIDENKANLSIEADVKNTSFASGELKLTTELTDPEGKIVTTVHNKLKVDERIDETIKQPITVTNPKLWSVEHPNLYTAKSVLLSGNKIIDNYTTVFGIRSIEVSVKKGLLLNGKRVILKGGCVHHDNGPLGAAAIDRAEERKLEILKANGYNAIRTSHNPPSPYFLDVCDRLGLLVIDEAFDVWEHKKLFDDSLDYHHFFKDWWKWDLDAQVMRDRNHPSVICWSIGNEINERADTSGLRITKQLIDAIHRLDTTRPVTEGLCWFWDHPGRPWDSLAPAFALLDIGGYNYEWLRYEDDHQKYPERIMMGTETYAGEALQNFDYAEKYPYVLGDFLWTAWDYIGEAGIGHSFVQPKEVKEDKTMLQPWPWFNAWCGDIDLIGNKKPQSFYRDVVWRNSPIEMLVQRPVAKGMHSLANSWGWPDESKSWTWPGHEGDTLQVRVFSRSRNVRLELNGKSIGEQQIADSSITAVFNVPYAPGNLKAIAFDNNKQAGDVTIQSTGKPAGIRLAPDRSKIKPHSNDLSFVAVEVVDDKGNVVPYADMILNFKISGAGEIAAVGNADPTDMTSFVQPVKKVFNGRCLVVIRAKTKGKITVTANAEGIKQGSVVINAVY